MTIELTRELLEHYLRARSASLQTRAAIEREYARGATPLQAAIRTLGVEDILYLGLCVAAEQALIRIPVERKASRDCRVNDIFCATLEQRASECLGASGIDPAKWEATR